MRKSAPWIIALCLSVPVAAQAPAIITMDQEPHHHLAFKNNYIKIFDVEVSAGDSIALHRHDGDTVAIAIGSGQAIEGEQAGESRHAA